MTITMMSPLPDVWSSIKKLGAKRATWQSPVLHMRTDFDAEPMYDYDHNDGVLEVDFKNMHLLYVGHTLDRAIEVCMWDLRQKQQVQYVAVDPGSRMSFRYGRYAFQQHWHHVSVVIQSGPVYRSFLVEADESHEDVVRYVRRML